MTDFKNESGLSFVDISSEDYRQYRFSVDEVVHINSPLWLNVSKGGGHRVYDAQGISHYIRSGWIHLSWKAKDNALNFVK